MAGDVRLAAALAPGDEVAAFASAHPAAGGIVSFLGQVRCGDGVEALELRHYEPLTLPGMLSTAGHCDQSRLLAMICAPSL